MKKKSQKKVQPPLNQRRLKELLHYDPDTGIFRWKVYRKRSKAAPGDVAGKRHPSQKYVRIGFDGWMWPAHRLAFLYMIGRWPEQIVDHIDRNPLNNRWSNLREATHSQNRFNSKMTVRNKTGFKGVSPEGNRWIASIMVSGESHYLGCFATPEEAHRAYCKAAQKIAGEFARAQ